MGRTKSWSKFSGQWNYSLYYTGGYMTLCIKHPQTIWFSSPTSSCELKAGVENIFVHQSPLAALAFLRWYLLMAEWINKMWYTEQWNIIQPSKGLKFGYMLQHGPWRHCAKWNKPDTKWQVLYNSTYMRYLTKWTVVTRSQEWEEAFDGYSFRGVREG